MSASEYLAWERGQFERHEFYQGEVFAMAGGSTRHAALAAAIIGQFQVEVDAIYEGVFELSGD